MYDAVPSYSKIEDFEIPDWRGTKIANMRLFLADVIPNCPESLLYLDSDTIVVGDLSTLLMQKQRQPIAAVYDHLDKSYWQNLSSSLKHYYNSGVLQFDYNLLEKNRGYYQIEKVMQMDYSLTFPDQDILNLAFQEQIATLSAAYNLFPVDLYYDIYTLQKYYQNTGVEFYEKEELLHAKRFPKILHATDFYGVRPWQKNRIHPFQSQYLEYLIKTCGHWEDLEDTSISCANINPYLFKLFNYARIYTPKEVRQGVKRILTKSVSKINN